MGKQPLFFFKANVAKHSCTLWQWDVIDNNDDGASNGWLVRLSHPLCLDNLPLPFNTMIKIDLTDKRPLVQILTLLQTNISIIPTKCTQYMLVSFGHL